MLEQQFTFQGLSNSAWFMTSVAAVTAAVVLILMLVRYERQLVPPRVGYMLIALRIGVIAVLLLTLFEPVLSWQVDRERSGRIVVAVDLSESMETVDRHALTAEKMRWARGLGMIGNDSINERLDGWIEALEENREPEWVGPDENGSDANRKAIKEAREEYVNGIITEFDEMPRTELTRRLITLKSFPVIEELQSIGAVELQFFAGKSEVADLTVLEGEKLKASGDVHPGESNIAQVLAKPTGEESENPVRATVLFTDGRHNGRQDPVAIATRMNAIGAPIFPVLIGSTNKPKDVALVSLDYPKATIKGDKAIVEATLIASGFEGETIEVELIDADKTVVDRQTVNVDQLSQVVSFDLDTEALGRKEYTVRVEPDPEELRDDNNDRSFGINVVDDRSRVLLIEGSPRWEFRFLDAALERDDRVEMASVVFEQPYLARLPNTFFRRKLPWLPAGQEVEDTPLSEIDLLIVGDVASHQLSESAWKQFESFVSEAGGTLILLAGKNHFPMGHRSPVVDRLLPITDLQPLDLSGESSKRSPNERGFQLRMTPEGEREDVLRFDIDVEQNRQIWSGLPGHFWGLFGEPKLGATIWAYAAAPGNVDLKTERERAVIIHQHYGVGQVLWIGIDSTWRWRHRVGDEYHHRFWGQMARWAATNKATAGNEFVKFGPDSTDLEVGQDAVFRARFTRQALNKFPDIKVFVEIYRLDPELGDELASTVELTPIEARPTVFEGRAVSLAQGNYRLELKAENANIGTDIVAPLFVQNRQTPELADLSANVQLLQRIADASDGRLLRTDELRRLPDLLELEDDTAQSHEEQSLWDHWLVMTLFFAFLTTEWVIRKLNGLP